MQAVLLTRDPIQSVRVEAVGYGAKDTGEMGGGAAAAILAAAGPELLHELKAKLANSSHRVGDVAVTPAFKMQASGVRLILHVVSIIKHTPQGAYCPEPERLRGGVTEAVRVASKLGARSVVFSALGTGEGRVDPRMAAMLMLNGAKDFWRTESNKAISITFSLPSYRDYEAFAAVAQTDR